MIPTTWPYGKDPRMCAYCDKKDTCNCRCDKNTDVIWGDITGDLADQTDLMAVINKHTTTSTPFPTLKIRGQNLYICAPTGMLRTTDKVKFARYVSSSDSHWINKNGVKTDEKAVRKHTGWIRPKLRGNLQKDLVQMSMALDTKLSNALTEYWKLSVLYQDDSEGTMNWDSWPARGLYSVMVESVCYYLLCHFDEKKGDFIDDETGKSQEHASNYLVDLFGKKLGVCIERNGVQITDYMPFACTFTLGESDSIPDSHIMKGQSLSLFHIPNHLMSFRQYMKIRQSVNGQTTAETEQ